MTRPPHCAVDSVDHWTVRGIDLPNVDDATQNQKADGNALAIIIVTAQNEFTLRGYTVDAEGKVLRPASTQCLSEAIASLQASFRGADSIEATFPIRLALPVGRRIQMVDVATIDWVRAQGNYIELHSGGQHFLLRKTMAWIESQLDPNKFLRVHRSCLVRASAVVAVHALSSGRYRLHLVGGKSLASGRSYRDRLRQNLGLLLT